MNIGVVRQPSPDHPPDALLDTLRRLGWEPAVLSVQDLNLAAREAALAVAVVDWPDDQPDWLRSICERMAVVTLHAPLGSEGVAASAQVGAIAAFDASTAPVAWVPSLPIWVATQSQRIAAARREREQRGSISDARTISAAVGMLAQRHGVTIDQAFAQLRNQARAQRKRLELAASDILEAHKGSLARI